MFGRNADFSDDDSDFDQSLNSRAIFEKSPGIKDSMEKLYDNCDELLNIIAEKDDWMKMPENGKGRILIIFGSILSIVTVDCENGA